jgi:cytochrome c oxidase cbb3-type subunit 1
MAASYPLKSNLPPASKGFASTNPELAAIDASVRVPVMVCFLSAVHWLVVGTVLLVYASSLAHPQDALPILSWFVDLSNNCGFFTYGRVWPAAIDSLVYGWASISGLGLAIWILARTSRTVVRSPGALLTGIIFWNIGLGLGLTGIFLGDGTGVELLEFPACASVTMWLAYTVFAVWAVITYMHRPEGRNRPAQAWILVALFAFPWLFGAGTILLGSGPLPGTGVVQELIGAWYIHGIYTLWLAPLGLGILYYLIPKVSGLTIRFSSKTNLAFWTWLFIAPWTAVHDLVGGPFPAETVTVGLALSGLLFIPVALIGLNLVPASLAGEEKYHGGIVLPFLTLSAIFFVVAGASEQLLSIRTANELLRFTMFRECNQLLWIYGFFSFAVFGAMYYAIPRLLNFGWRSGLLIRAHYFASLYGILLVIVMLGFGGVSQGLILETVDPLVTIDAANQVALSFYIATTMCIALVSIGNGIFALHLGWMLVEWLRVQVRGSRLASDILLEPYEPLEPVKVATPGEVSA